MKDEEKAKELASKYARQYHHNTYPEQSSNGEFVFSNEEIEKACLEMAEWKDSQLKQTLMQFFKYLDKRGFLDPMLQCDPEHQIDTFLEQFNNDVEID